MKEFVAFRSHTSSFLISSSLFSFCALRSCSRCSNEKGHISIWLFAAGLGWKGTWWGTGSAFSGAGAFTCECAHKNFRNTPKKQFSPKFIQIKKPACTSSVLRSTRTRFLSEKAGDSGTVGFSTFFSGTPWEQKQDIRKLRTPSIFVYIKPNKLQEE